MNDTLQKTLDKALCSLVQRATGLIIVYNEKRASITINNKGPFLLTKAKRDDLIELIKM